MISLHFDHALVSRMRPQLVSAHRRLGLEELFGHMPRSSSWAGNLSRWLDDSRRALVLVLDGLPRLVAANSELASLGFFVILIALTFLI